MRKKKKKESHLSKFIQIVSHSSQQLLCIPFPLIKHKLFSIKKFLRNLNKRETTTVTGQQLKQTK